MRVAFVPSAPLLLLGGAPDDLAAAVAKAVDSLEGEVVVVGAAPTPGAWEGSVDLTPYGLRGTPAPDPLPLSLAVGAALLGERPHRLWGVPSDALPDAPSYLVVMDGTAKRTLKAPGHLDQRAEAFDATIEAALADGDAAALLALDEQLAGELWVQGLPALRAAAGLGASWRGQVLYAGAPYGVGYVVAVWDAPAF
jgi:hypothetical protein